MRDAVFKTVLLGFIIIIVFCTLAYLKTPTTEGFQTTTTDGLARDADNPNLKDDMVYGSIPQAASASIFKKAEIRGQTSNPDAINIDEKTGGAMVEQTDFDMAVDPDDIQSQLEQVAGTEGFQSLADQAKGQAQASAQDKLQEVMQNKLKEQAKKSKGGKAAAKAKKVLLKKATKSAQKLNSKFGKKLGGNMIKKIMEKVAAKLGKKIGEKSAIAGVKAGAFSSNPVTVVFGVVLSVIAAIGVVLQVVIITTLKGDEGVCEPGYDRFGAVWPDWLNNIPGVGDIMGVLSPYLCYRNACDPNQEEDAGLCYPKCDPGYKGIGPVCWANKNDSKGKPADKTPCPPGMRDDGTSCWKDTLPNGVGTVPRTYGGGCRGGGCSTSCPQWYSCRTSCEPVKCDPISSTCDNKVNVAGLCYNSCPSGYHFAGGNLCEPDGGPGIKKMLMDRQYCSDKNTELAHAITTVDQMCYTKCPSDTPYRVPGMPYICSAAKEVGDGRGKTSYGRGVGKPKLKLKTANPTPPPPPPPPTSSSLTFADGPLAVDYASSDMLQKMAQFYYIGAISNAATNADGSISFGYITKITSVVASSEQSADLLCDITNMVLNPDTGKVSSSNTVVGQDRRFYFAKLAKAKTFVVTAATNVNGTAPDVKNVELGPVAVTFTPTIQKCADVPITLNKCTGQDTVDAMMKMYTDTIPKTVRVKSIDGIENTGADTCTVAWTEHVYNSETNMEQPPQKKVGIFTFLQDKSNDACTYKLQKYSAGDSKINVKSLAKPITFAAALPAEVSLQGCQTTCKDTALLTKLITAFNTNPSNTNRIVTVGKAVTPAPLRCDIEADVYVKQTKTTEKQRIRFDLSKDGGSCMFNVVKIGNVGSGSFIQDNTPMLGSAAAANTSEFITSAQTDNVRAAQAKLSGVSKSISGYLGAANNAYEKTFADLGQAQSLGSCPKKCTDPDILESIMTYYNNANYPATRVNVTKKTMTRVLKAGTASSNECDITFEEKQEVFSDLYGDSPKTTITQRTQRFKMKDTGNCSFVVEAPAAAATAKEGFQSGGAASSAGLPGMSRPIVVNNASPNLATPYTGSGCDLDCTKADMLRAVKQKYDGSSIEGFSNFMTTIWSGNWFSNVREAFQDTTEDVVAEDGGEVVSDLVSDEVAADGEVAEEVAPSNSETEVAPPTKVITSTTMKKVNRALRIGPDKCEYEVTYDSVGVDTDGNSKETKDGVGYFQATFSKDKVGCSYMPSQVVKTTSPIIPSVPSAKTSNISFSF